MVIKFEELHRIKNSLPSGSMQKIADDLGVDIETVQNNFGDFSAGIKVSMHIEKDVNGGYVKLDNPEIFEYARILLEEYQARNN